MVSGGGSYDLGSEVTLTAVPESGYKFSYWTGDASSVRAWFSYAIGANGLVEKSFKKDDVSIKSLNVAASDAFFIRVRMHPDAN